MRTSPISPIKPTTNNRPAATANGAPHRQVHEHTAKSSPMYHWHRPCRHSVPIHGLETRHRPPYGRSPAGTDSFHDPLKSP